MNRSLIHAQLLKHRNAISLVLFALLGLIALLSSLPDAESAPASGPPDDVSTFIPRGHLLVPIELRNADQLEGLLGSHGFVDLFEEPVEPGSRSRLVGRRIRLLRAPLNPRAFAVLVRESEAEKFLSFRGALIASVRPPETEGHEIVSERRRRAPVIEFQKEEKP